ncbi:hypothetical protein JCM17844_07580 [Iodidimonas gelatinilytica]|nr:pseudouridine synthase [Iodidimonas gelatinilytica]GEQ97121.1 hypothetical protein JCM17844_07580 [Iodidimonas gelatinilytica]
MSSSFEMVASTDNTPNRLDRWLSIQVSGQNHDLSRSRVKALIEAGHATINDQTIRNASAAVKPGDHICLHIPAAEAAEPESQDIPLVVAYEDDALIVVDKPAGMVVHPAPGAPDGTLVNALLHHCGDSLSGIGGVRRPGIVHRIDKDTSGLLVVAKSDAAHHGLAAQFADHSLHRRYIAFTRGHPNPAEGR